MSRYPSEPELDFIEKYDVNERGFRGLLDYLHEIWEYGFTEKDDPENPEKLRVELVTGGWSGNEDIIHSLSQNVMFWSLSWEQSTRGGLHVFLVPKFMLLPRAERTHTPKTN